MELVHTSEPLHTFLVAELPCNVVLQNDGIGKQIVYVLLKQCPSYLCDVLDLLEFILNIEEYPAIPLPIHLLENILRLPTQLINLRGRGQLLQPQTPKLALHPLELHG